MLRILILSLIVATVFGCSDIGKTSPKGDIRSPFDARAPFGYSWDRNELSLSSTTDGTEDYHFFEAEDIISPFQGGEIMVAFTKDGGIQGYQYSYQHRSFHGDVEEHERLEKMRKAKAAEFKPRLIELYGRPDAVGTFSQGSTPGFQKIPIYIELPKPCSLWVGEQHAIELCSTRWILIDGVEMSLTYYNLAEYDYADGLREATR